MSEGREETRTQDRAEIWPTLPGGRVVALAAIDDTYTLLVAEGEMSPEAAGGIAELLQTLMPEHAWHARFIPQQTTASLS